eukprot:6552498-Prymnesium_polylepis.1
MARAGWVAVVEQLSQSHFVYAYPPDRTDAGLIPYFGGVKGAVEWWCAREAGASSDMVAARLAAAPPRVGASSGKAQDHEYTVGTRVEVWWGGGVQWFSGAVDKLHQDGSLAVSYDDGDSEHRVARKR